MSDERTEARREVIAELVEVARRHVVGHAELYENAVDHGREEMAQRAYSNQNAWMEVAGVAFGRTLIRPLG